MLAKDLREKFIRFFEKKGHKIVPSSSLIPDDKTVLLTSAGMQQFIPYLSGEKDVLADYNSRHLASVQKCFRTDDIDEVGDDTHHTFFEMLGNWSIGEDSKDGYFKEGAIKLALDFFINEIGLDKDRFWITIFKGGDKIPKDQESFNLWQKYGISSDRIKEFGSKDNFWGPTAKVGPCGPCSEIHYDRGEEYGCKDPLCGPNCVKCKRFVELWNLVFMEYMLTDDGSYIKLPQRNVDTGIGFERLLALLNNKDSAYETDLFIPIIKELESISKGRCQDNKKNFRIIADHIRGAVFLTADGVFPSNVESGYILRRIIRRAVRFGRIINMPYNFLIPLAVKVIENYNKEHPELMRKKTDILTLIQNEEEKFEKTLERGLKEFKSQIKNSKSKLISSKLAFNLYQSYGFPFELTKELAEEEGFKIDEESFKQELKKHQEISRKGAERKFGGIGKEADSYEAVKLHTATHLLHQALRDILGKDIRQMGSDITSERLRFDFSYPQKMTEEQIKKVEDIVNQKIKEGLKVDKKEMPFKEALDWGALAFFKEKYPQNVSVYSIGSFSKEVCAGPHVERTSELGDFKIIKEESSSKGVRRIRAVLK
ncbi:MAG: alanine--tRNA ligase [Candidatus Pacebacteria bacterium]|nr:alanine--tRNA ligase [Candidatus Paceibacterota bacterium]